VWVYTLSVVSRSECPSNSWDNSRVAGVCTVVVQHVRVTEGGQAVITGSVASGEGAQY